MINQILVRLNTRDVAQKLRRYPRFNGIALKGAIAAVTPKRFGVYRTVSAPVAEEQVKIAIQIIVGEGGRERVGRGQYQTRRRRDIHERTCIVAHQIIRRTIQST